METVIRFFEFALKYVKKNHLDELSSFKNRKPFDVGLREFIEEYCWVVYAAGFKVKILEKKFSKLKKCFFNFNAKKIVKNKDQVIRNAFKIIKNERKVRSFVKGVELILKEGFENFKKRVLNEGTDVLRELPYIGETTKKHLARNIGFMNEVKDDRWLKRVSRLLGFRNVDKLGKYLSLKFKMEKGVVDLVVWRFCADKAWKNYGYKNLQEFIQSLKT